MILWQTLIEGAKSKTIHKNREQAFEWLRQHVPELFVRPLDEDGQPYVDEAGREEVQALFNWDSEWTRWEKNFQAILWLAERWSKPPEPLTEEDCVPPELDAVIEASLQGTRPMIIGKSRPTVLATRYSDSRLVIQFSGTMNATHTIGSLEEFWQVVFVSFYRPDLLPYDYSFCSACGKSLPPTRKRKKPSKAKLCPSCRVAKHRREHPEETREAWREQKRREREASRAGWPAGESNENRR